MHPQWLRRLAADLATLHNEPLPPNYLFDPSHDDHDDLTQLDIMLAGPSHTPFAGGLWKLHLNIPDDYPQQPPTANFRTAIFHPNVHPETGAVCVETLKRDWDNSLTLRDVLVTISCLLIQPNPDSALNADAGGLLQEDYDLFARRARLMTSIHAIIPASLAAAVAEAQTRGQDGSDQQVSEGTPEVIRKRRPIARPRRAVKARISDQSPADRALKQRQVVRSQQQADDVFQTPPKPNSDEMEEDEQENHSGQQLDTPMLASAVSTPRRPHGAPVPLGELTLDPSDDDMEPEYPPSPKKSPSKSPAKRSLFLNSLEARSNQGAARQHQTPSSLSETDMSIAPFASFDTPAFRLQPVPRPVFQAMSEHDDDDSMSGVEVQSTDNERLWNLCGHDVDRWNRGDFDDQPFGSMAARW